MVQKCLIIADDLTGGADTGAQFAKMGLSTLLISLKGGIKIDFSKYAHRDVFVVNTDSRRLSPEKAFHSVSMLLKGYDRKLFPIIYKKIDSTLRGNIGYEIDAILNETNSPICFMAPSYPEQNRTLVGGIMMVEGRPLALTEVAHDAASPVTESHVHKLLRIQSRNKIGRIDLTHVASSSEQLQKAVKNKQNKGDKIIIFDAVNRRDLTNIVDVAFHMTKKPLLVGSAGLAEEVAEKLSPSMLKPSQGRVNPVRKSSTFQREGSHGALNLVFAPFRDKSLTGFAPKGILFSPRKRPEVLRGSSPLQAAGLSNGVKPFNHILIVSGSASGVTHQQLNRLKERKIPEFQINHSLVMRDDEKGEKELSKKIASSLAQGPVILKMTSEILSQDVATDLPIHFKIPKTLAAIALSVLEESNIHPHDLALILTGGDTAMSVINNLRIEGVEIEGEPLKGIVKGHLIGGIWDGLSVITKAGAFGKENALEKIVEILESGSSSQK